MVWTGHVVALSVHLGSNKVNLSHFKSDFNLSGLLPELLPLELVVGAVM